MHSPKASQRSALPPAKIDQVALKIQIPVLHAILTHSEIIFDLSLYIISIAFQKDLPVRKKVIFRARNLRKTLDV
jgi:hypothetical protein